jgi:hypothetical protein
MPALDSGTQIAIIARTKRIRLLIMYLVFDLRLLESPAACSGSIASQVLHIFWIKASKKESTPINDPAAF